ncbi:MAG: transcriptional regulator [Cupriavidus sp.]|nr:transcriptional regulator [Cupriavidus sp.]
MSLRHAMWGAAGLLALVLAGFGAWLLRLPAPVAAEAKPIAQAETDAMLAALKPPKRKRPLVAVVGLNDATETTDYLMPTGILRRADVADVLMLAKQAGAVRLYPALSVQADTTIADFDARHAEGADYVIVPAMSRDDDPAVLAWLRAQAGKGAVIIGVCAGAKVVAAAGLLDGRRATTHWYYRQDLFSRHPAASYVANRRMVVDGNVATTTGISASMPTMLTLIEAIAGSRRAAEVALDLGVSRWDASHASDAFAFTRPFAATVLGNVLASWKKEEIGIELRPGVDEVSLALVADAWSRTYRSRAITLAPTTAAVESRNGIRVLPDELAVNRQEKGRTLAFVDQKAAHALDQSLRAIEARYGRATADVVALQLEYSRRQP